MKSLVTISLMVAVAAATGTASAAPAPQPIIDVHLHANPIPPAGPRPVNCGSELQEFASRDGRPQFNIDQVRSRCDKVLVAPASDADNRAAVLKYLQQYNMTATILGAAPDIQLWHEQFGQRAIPGLSLTMPGSPPVAQIREAILTGTAALVGEVSTQYAGISPDAASLEPYFALAEELDFPVSLHIGLGAPAAAYVGQDSYLASLTHPLLLEPVLRRHPRLRINVMHGGWPMTDEMIHLMYSHPQVYVDTGIIDWGIPRKAFYYHLQRLVDAGFGNRILVGTDQMLWPDAIPVAIEAIRQAPFLSEAQKRDIFYNNAVRFLHLEPDASGALVPRRHPTD